MPDLSAYDQAVKLLARRTHFRRELEQKLVQRRYPSDEIEEALDRLESRRYLDDEDASRQFVEGRLASGGYGRARLAAELAARGVDCAVARRCSTSCCPRTSCRRRGRRRRAGRGAPARAIRRPWRGGSSGGGSGRGRSRPCCESTARLDD